MRKDIRLAPKEEEILGFFWKKGPLFVREIIDLYSEPRPHFNTVSTIVRELESKGCVAHREFGRSFQYYATISAAEYRKAKLSGVIDRYFGKSVFNAVSTLVQSEDDLTDEEVRLLVEQIKSRRSR